VSKLVVKSNFRHCTIFDENLVAVKMKKTRIYYNKPVYLGMCILDLSKTHTYIKRIHSTMIISNKIMEIRLNYYSQTPILYHMKYGLKTGTKI